MSETAAPLLATRDALARWFCAYRHDCVEAEEGFDNYTCDHGFGYRDADALLASGVVRDPATLADDMKRLAAKWEAERHDHRHIAGAPSQIDAGIRVTLRACADDLHALAAALAEDPS